MPAAIYYGVTLVLYGAESFVSTLGLPIPSIFSYIAVFSGTTISFFVPSLFVIIGFKNFATPRFMEENGKWVTVAWVNFFMGIFFFILLLGSSILSAVFTPDPIAKGITACKLSDFGTGTNK